MNLVNGDWLAEHLDDPDVVVLEVSFQPLPAAAWASGHIPGALHMYWKDLCWDETERQFPGPEEMARRLGGLGVGDDSTLVLVGDPIQFATYAYWAITMAGLEDRVAVLDGGHRTWEEQGRPMTDEVPPWPRPRTVTPGTAHTESRVGRDDVRSKLGDASRILLDMRSREEFVGERVSPVTAPFDHGAERGGHIPGAVHFPHENLLNPDGTFRTADEVEAAAEAARTGDEDEIVTYCRLSHRASLGWFALTRIADRHDVAVYDGSWTEWGSMVGNPIER